MNRVVGIAALAALFVWTPAAIAQEAPQAWPSRTVTVVVGAGPGGTNDTIARMIATKLSQNLRANFVVENKPGAGTVIATSAVSKATPDGYTLLSTSASLTTAPLMFQTNYDSKTDLTPISQFVDAPFIVVAHSSLGVKTFKDYVDYLKKNPGKVNWGSLAGQQEIGGRWLDKITGTSTVNIPYKDASLMYTDILTGGSVQASMIQAPAIIQHIQSGAVRALAWSGLKRNALLPDLPTVAELGYPDYNVSLWQGVFGPKGMDPALASRISAEVAKVAKDPDIMAKMATLGFTLVGSKPEEFKTVVHADLDRWATLGAEIGLKKR